MSAMQNAEEENLAVRNAQFLPCRNKFEDDDSASKVSF